MRNDKIIPAIPGIITFPTIKDDIDDSITIKKSVVIIILLLLFILFMIGLTVLREPTNLKVICSNNNEAYVKNNIQASHTYDIKPYMVQSNDTSNMYCFSKIDTIGTLLGSSMQPTFFEGNTALLKNYTTDMVLHTGDIIRYYKFNDIYKNCTSLYDNSSMAVIHRINAVYKDVIITQGDNNNGVERIDRCQITSVILGILFT